MLLYYWSIYFFFFFSSRRRHTRWPRDWSSDVCSSDLYSSRNTIPAPSDITKPSRPLSKGRLAFPGSSFNVDIARMRENPARSEERRVGKECRTRGAQYH